MQKGEGKDDFRRVHRSEVVGLKIGSLRILNLFSAVSLAGGEVYNGISPGAAIESVRACPANEPIIPCLSLQRILARTSKEDVVSVATFDPIITASTADQVIATFSIDAIPALGADDDIISASSLQLSSIALAVIRPTDDVTRGVHVDRGSLPVAHWRIWPGDPTMR